MFRYVSLTSFAVVAATSVAFAQGSFEDARNKMVDEEIVAAGVKNERVVEAMRETPRHQFIPLMQRRYAYYDMALPIGEQQTISPPFVVAYMTEQIDPQPGDKVLEIGTGSGYQAAVLSPLVDEVYSIEIVGRLGRRAAATLRRLGYRNVHVKVGDGYKGWPEHAPFDKIIVTCSPEKVPQPLIDQLREGGLMIVPAGERYQQTLYLLTKKNGKLQGKALRPTLFVPMTGAAEERRGVQPDPLNPSIANGGFEQIVDGTEQPAFWHYQRQVELVEDRKTAPEGERFIAFSNDDPGRASHALQGFAVDGRKVSELGLSIKIRGSEIRYGQDRTQWPRVVVIFYDDRRATLDTASMGPWFGSFDWQTQTARIPVPLAAREAIIRIGLLGAIGEFAIDDIQIKAVQN